MDFSARYFKNDPVMTRYLSSSFHGHTTAEDLKLKFEEATQNLDTKSMVQVSVDGLNVSWKMLSKITEERSSTEHYTGLINVGSCSLHVVPGVFRSGKSKTKWGIETLLKALHKLFHESSAKREDYTKITEVTSFHYHSVAQDGLKTKVLLKGHCRSGLKSLPTSVRP